MLYNYYETIAAKINAGQCRDITFDNLKNNREIWCVVNFRNGQSCNIYRDGQAKISRVECVLKAIEKKLKVVI